MYSKEYYKKNSKRLNKKAMEYQSTLASISIRMKPEVKKMYKEAADKAGVPLRKFILDAMDEKIAKMNE